MIGVEALVENVPECVDVSLVCGFCDLQSQSLCLADAAFPTLLDGKSMGEGNAGGDAASHELGILAKEGIEGFFGRIPIIYIRCGLIDKTCGSEFPLVVVFQQGKHFQHFFAGGFSGEDESAVCKSLVGIDGGIVLRIVGRQTCDGFVALEEDDGAVGKSCLMVVHESSVEEEGSVLGVGHYLVPDGKEVGGVSNYL